MNNEQDEYLTEEEVRRNREIARASERGDTLVNVVCGLIFVFCVILLVSGN